MSAREILIGEVPVWAERLGPTDAGDPPAHHVDAIIEDFLASFSDAKALEKDAKGLEKAAKALEKAVRDPWAVAGAVFAYGSGLFFGTGLARPMPADAQGWDAIWPSATVEALGNRELVKVQVQNFAPEGCAQKYLDAIIPQVTFKLRGIAPGDPRRKRDERIQDIVLVHGLVRVKPDHLSVAAFERFVDRMETWLGLSDRWLRTLDLPEYQSSAAPERHEAQVMALCLVNGVCACWRTNALGEPADHNARQNRIRCLRDHALIGWNPAKASLNDFIGTAVKGGTAPRDFDRGEHGVDFNAGGFSQGMYFCQILKPAGYKSAEVLLWCCQHVAKPERERRTRDVDLKSQSADEICAKDHDHHMHQGSRCPDPDCDAEFSEVAHRCWTQIRLLLPFDKKGRYQPYPYWKCSNPKCLNFYRASLPTCPAPKCGKAHGPNASTVWKRTGGPVADAEAVPDMAPTREERLLLDEQAAKVLELAKRWGVRVKNMEELAKLIESDPMLRGRIRRSLDRMPDLGGDADV